MTCVVIKDGVITFKALAVIKRTFNVLEKISTTGSQCKQAFAQIEHYLHCSFFPGVSVPSFHIPAFL